MSTKPIFHTHTHSVGFLFYDLDVVISVSFAHAIQLQSFKKNSICTLLVLVCDVRVQCFLFYYFGHTNPQFHSRSQCFSALALDISIDQSHTHTHTEPFFILPHHITQNFRLAWRIVDDANADDESERYRSDRKTDRIVLRIQSIRIESSPQPFSVTNF